MSGATWRREGYPETGDRVPHQHGGQIGHEHIGGDLAHGHKHRRETESSFVDEFYLSAAQEAREARLIEPCRRCNGTGEIQECRPQRGDVRCSHVWDDVRTCPACDGNG